jgi:trans-aconitate methyltransferase
MQHSVACLFLFLKNKKMDPQQAHWERVYTTKQPHEVSWTQSVPTTSLTFLREFELPKSARIIDVGGGDSQLVDHLLAEGYRNVTVLDISEKALEKAQKRLGDAAKYVTWVVSDVTTYQPTEAYDLWHDRATFHFLTTPDQIERYLHLTRQAVGGYLLVATFSEQGPQKCSGLDIRQYSQIELAARFEAAFEKIRCLNEDHVTPFETVQNFTFCGFKRHRA